MELELEKKPWELYKYRNHRHPTKIPQITPLSDKNAFEKVFSILSAKPDQKRPKAIYVHIPFCKIICPFCPFFKNRIDDYDINSFLDSLLQEISFVSKFSWNKHLIEAVHIGGGTPTALPSSYIVRIVEYLKTFFSLDPNCEISIESRFFDMTRNYLKKIRNAGINRISFGVQSFDTKVRRSIGRLADKSVITKIIGDALDIGFPTVSVDLMYPLLHQTIQTWESDINKINELGINGACVYRFNSHKRNLNSHKEKTPQQDIELEYKLFKIADQFLCKTLKWERVAGSYYAKKNASFRYINFHYSTENDVLPVGPGAFGQIGSLLFENDNNLAKYLSHDIQESNFRVWPIDELYCDSWGYHDLSVKLNLNTEKKPQQKISRIEDLILSLIDRGLAERDGNFVKLTEIGVFWSRNIYLDFQKILEEELQMRQKA